MAETGGPEPMEITMAPRGDEFKITSRPGMGQRGRKIKLRTNYFLAKYDAKVIAHHHDVRFKPELPSRVKMGKLMDDAVAKGVFGGVQIVYDGAANLFTAKPLPNGPVLSVEGLVIKGDEERTFSMTVKEVARVDFSRIGKAVDNQAVRDVLQVMDIAMRYHFMNSCISIGRSLYDATRPHVVPIDGVCEIWKGHFQAIRPIQGSKPTPGMMQLALNIDDSAIAMIKSGMVLDRLAGLLGRNFDPTRGMNPRDVDFVNKNLRNIRIVATHSKYRRQYRMSKLADVPANKDMFECDGKKVSVADYFQKQYNLRLKYPNLPCVKVGTKGTSMPIELCDIVPGQRYMHTLTTEQRNGMLQATTEEPRKRIRSVQDCAARVSKEINSDPSAKAFGLQIDSRMMEVEGRMLQPPTLEYGNKAVIQPANGAWNLKDLRVLESLKCPKDGYQMVCINFSERTPMGQFEEFWRGFQRTLDRTGIKLAGRAPFEQPQRGKSLADQLKGYRDKYKADMFLCLLDMNQKQVYAQIKEICETQLGLPTQCVCSKNVAGKMCGSPQYHANIGLKVNIKLGGMNQKLQKPPQMPSHMKGRPVMVMGADVHHPPPADETSPSIAAVVGSFDQQFARYNTAISPQERKQREETIRNMTAITRQLLIGFYRSNKMKPESIIMFRDGVGEGQFEIVMNEEVSSMIKAFQSLEPGYRPKITFLIVQKRNRTRFFPGDSPEEADRMGNMKAGTVIDTGVCHPETHDYFLCSHGGLKGTSKPTHYHVMYDENNFTADDVQELTNSMCYLYQRCTRSVSVPAPAYYAHFAAYRTSIYSKPGPVQEALAGKLYYL